MVLGECDRSAWRWAIKASMRSFMASSNSRLGCPLLAEQVSAGWQGGVRGGAGAPDGVPGAGPRAGRVAVHQGGAAAPPAGRGWSAVVVRLAGLGWGEPGDFPQGRVPGDQPGRRRGRGAAWGAGVGGAERAP